MTPVEIQKLENAARSSFALFEEEHAENVPQQGSDHASSDILALFLNRGLAGFVQQNAGVPPVSEICGEK
jgi:hypothetical protein